MDETRRILKTFGVAVTDFEAEEVLEIKNDRRSMRFWVIPQVIRAPARRLESA